MDVSQSFHQGEKRICVLSPAVISMKYRREGMEMQLLPEQVKVQRDTSYIGSVFMSRLR